MEYSLVFHSSWKPQSVSCSWTERSVENWNYMDIKNNSEWRSNCPSVYLSPPRGSWSYCNRLTVRSIFQHITPMQVCGSLFNRNGWLTFWILPQEEEAQCWLSSVPQVSWISTKKIRAVSPAVKGNSLTIYDSGIFLLQLTQFVRNEGSRKENEELSKIVNILYWITKWLC